MIAKLKLGVVDTKGDVDLLEQRIKEAMGDLRGHIEDLQEGLQGSSVHTVSQEELVTFQDKVLSMLTRLESRVDALTRHVEARDEQMRQELAIYKDMVFAWFMVTNKGLEDSYTTGGGEKMCLLVLPGMRRARCPILGRIRARVTSGSMRQG